MNFVIIDIIFIIIIVFCIIRCVINGFVKEFFSKLALIGGAVLGLLFYGYVTPLLPATIPDFIINIAGFLIIFILAYIVIRIIERIIGLAFRGEIMAGLDRALGLFLGIFEGLLISSLIILLLITQSLIDVSGLFNGSFFYDLLTPFILRSANFMQDLAVL